MEFKATSAPPKNEHAGAATSNLSGNTTYIVKQVLLQTLPKQPALDPRPPGWHLEDPALPPSVRDFYDLSATIFNSRALSSQ